MSLTELSEVVVTGRPFVIGMVIEHKLTATLRMLADARYAVTQEVSR